jgi:hypothetical protein
MIDLAPHNPNGLLLRSPVIVAPGCDSALSRDELLVVGAVATRTAMLHSPRIGIVRWSSSPAGVVFERLPTVDLRTLLRESRRWTRSPAPILLSLYGTADELSEMVAQLEAVEGIAGLLLEVNEVGIDTAVATVRAQTMLPLLTLLPHGPTIELFAAEAVAAGADALVLCSYPLVTGVSEVPFEGLLVGPALAPVTLQALRQVKASVDVPLVAIGGVADAELAQHYLQAGATAVMVDGALYGDPYAPQRIAAALGDNTAQNARA